METTLKRIILTVLLWAAACQISFAQSAGQLVLNTGWLHIAPQSSSQPISVSALGNTAVETGTGSSVGSSDTFGLTATYFVTDHIALETILGVPPTLDLYGTGTIASFGKIGSARTWSPAVIAQYHFGLPDARIRPYLGLGVTYVWFSQVRLSNTTQSGQFLNSPTYGSALEGPSTARLSSSFAPIVNAGFTYNFNAHWSAGFSVSYIWLATHATLTTQSALGTITSRAKVTINPIVTFLSVGYRF